MLTTASAYSTVKAGQMAGLVDIFWFFVNLAPLKVAPRAQGGGFLVKRSIRGCAAEMGLKISLLV